MHVGHERDGICQRGPCQLVNRSSPTQACPDFISCHCIAMLAQTSFSIVTATYCNRLACMQCQAKFAAVDHVSQPIRFVPVGCLTWIRVLYRRPDFILHCSIYTKATLSGRLIRPTIGQVLAGGPVAAWSLKTRLIGGNATRTWDFVAV